MFKLKKYLLIDAQKSFKNLIKISLILNKIKEYLRVNLYL